MTEQEIREIEERAKKAADPPIRNWHIWTRRHARNDILGLCKEVRKLQGVIIREAGYLPSKEQEVDR